MVCRKEIIQIKLAKKKIDGAWLVAGGNSYHYTSVLLNVSLSAEELPSLFYSY